MVYLVDYENVNLYGMTGVEKLSAEDQVVVFLGNTTGAIPFEWHIRISDAAATVKYIKCGKVSKNYLDFQLATFCGYLIAGMESGKVFIVSKDKGFDSVVDFWTANKEEIEVRRVETIDESLGVPKKAEPEHEENTERAGAHQEKQQRTRRTPQRGRGRRGYVSRQNINGRKTENPSENEAKTEANPEVNQEIKPEEKTEYTAPEEAQEVKTEHTAPEEAQEVKTEHTAPGEAQEVKAEHTAPEEAQEVKAQEAQEKPVKPQVKLPESMKKRIRAKVKDEELKGGSYKTIYNIFLKETAKNRFNTALVKAFQQEKGNRIYKKLLPEFEEHLKEQ